MKPTSPSLLALRRALGLVLLCGLSAALPAQEPTPDQLVGRARQLAVGQRSEQSLPYYRQAVELLTTEGRQGERAGLLNEIGLVCFGLGQLDQAEEAYRQAIELYEAGPTSDGAALATTLNNLAALQLRRGRPDLAEPLYLRALELRRQTLGEGDAAVAFSLNELATLYHGLGRLDEAAELYQRSLAIEEVLLGGEHRQLIPRLTNLAVLYRVRGQPEKSGPLLRRALAISEKTYGADHPEVAAALNNLAVLESDLEHWDEAETLYRRALDIQRRVFGDDHFSLAMSLRNLASLYLRHGRETEAIAATGQMAAVLEANCDLERGLVRTPDQRTACRDARLMHRQLARQLRLGDDPTLPPAAAPPSAATAPPGVKAGSPAPQSVYRAQVKAYQERQLAEEDVPRLVERYATLLRDVAPHVVRADLGEKGVWYRIQLGDFPSNDQAQSLCRALAEAGHDGCWVVKTQRSSDAG